MKIDKQPFGSGGEERYILTNDNGLELCATPVGARIVSLKWQREEGEILIVPGFSNAQDYRTIDPYFGATIGRVAGRIANAQFELAGKTYELDRVEGPHSHHGGFQGFHTQVWQTDYTVTANQIELIFSYESPDMESGYLGNLQVKVHYILTNENEWRIHYEAKSDQETLFNPTNHAYFYTGLSQTDAKQAVRLAIKADQYMPIRKDGIPLGTASVEGTAFDFRQPEGCLLAERLASQDEQIRLVNGLDHGFVFPQSHSETAVAWLRTPNYQLTVSTDRPSLVVYTYNIGDSHVSMDQVDLVEHDVIAFETQVLPDAIHQPSFGSVVLKKDEWFTSTTTYRIEK